MASGVLWTCGSAACPGLLGCATPSPCTLLHGRDLPLPAPFSGRASRMPCPDPPPHPHPYPHPHRRPPDPEASALPPVLLQGTCPAAAACEGCEGAAAAGGGRRRGARGNGVQRVCLCALPPLLAWTMTWCCCGCNLACCGGMTGPTSSCKEGVGFAGTCARCHSQCLPHGVAAGEGGAGVCRRETQQQWRHACVTVCRARAFVIFMVDQH